MYGWTSNEVTHVTTGRVTRGTWPEVDVSNSVYFASTNVIRSRSIWVAYLELVEWSVTVWGPKGLLLGGMIRNRIQKPDRA